MVERTGRREAVETGGQPLDIADAAPAADAWFRAIFEHSNDAIFVLDAEADVILDANPRACRMLGYRRDELLTLPISTVHPDEMPQFLAFARSVLETGSGWTNENAMQDGRFRPDLFYRLNVFPIRIPALRERSEDIPLLVRYFVGKHERRLGKRIETIPQRALNALAAYSWPGNVRELENVIERAVIVSPGPRLELRESLPAPGARPPERRVPTLGQVDRQHIIASST